MVRTNCLFQVIIRDIHRRSSLTHWSITEICECLVQQLAVFVVGWQSTDVHKLWSPRLWINIYTDLHETAFFGLRYKLIMFFFHGYLRDSFLAYRYGALCRYDCKNRLWCAYQMMCVEIYSDVNIKVCAISILAEKHAFYLNDGSNRIQKHWLCVMVQMELTKKTVRLSSSIPLTLHCR